MGVPRDGYLDRPALDNVQRDRMRHLLDVVLPHNRFYAKKFAGQEIIPAVFELSDLARMPFTTKTELLEDQAAHPPYGHVLTFDSGKYCRMHQTSGTSGKPLRWLDTVESWDWLLDCWAMMFQIAGVGPSDRLFFPFSFGPFLGFWTAFDAASRRGWFCLPGGGLSSSARLRMLLDNQITVVFCTPTYGLHLAEVASQEKIDLSGSDVHTVIVAGEPGGSIPSTRHRIEGAWGARVLDHSGLTEVGALGIECRENRAGLHLLETECLAEVVDPETGTRRPVGEVGELVLTNLGRLGSPVIRYRTGDLARIDPNPCPCGRQFIRLDGGILGRADDMIPVRGNNLYPTALEAIIRRFPDVVEFRVEVDQSDSLTALRVEIEPVGGQSGKDIADRVSRAIRDELLFRADVIAVAPGTLPRFEMKATRIVKRKLGVEN